MSEYKEEVPNTENQGQEQELEETKTQEEKTGNNNLAGRVGQAIANRNETVQKAKNAIDNVKRAYQTIQNVTSAIWNAILNIGGFIVTPAGWITIGVILLLWIGVAGSSVFGSPDFSMTCNVLNDKGEWTTAICKTEGDGGEEGRVKQADAKGSDSTETGNADAKSGSLGDFSQSAIDKLNDKSNPNNTYPFGQCTWGVKQLAPWIGNYWGNANQWAISAKSNGFKTGSKPKVGSVIVWTGGQAGHVAYVVAVKSETEIQVLEANYGVPGGTGGPIGNYRGWFNPTTEPITYIYEK